MKKILLKKIINSESGESMSEVLIAALIIELALIMAVSMIVTSGRMIIKSKKSYTQYINRKNAISSLEQEESPDDAFTVSDIVGAPSEAPGKVTLTEGSESHTIDVSVFSVTSPSNNNITVLKRYTITTEP